MTKVHDSPIAYRWINRIAAREEHVKKEETIMVGCPLCSYYYSPQKIHPWFIYPNKYGICRSKKIKKKKRNQIKLPSTNMQKLINDPSCLWKYIYRLQQQRLQTERIAAKQTSGFRKTNQANLSLVFSTLLVFSSPNSLMAVKRLIYIYIYYFK